LADEHLHLGMQSSTEEREADPSGFEIFGAMVTVDNLAGGDVTKWEEVKAMPYETIFAKLLLIKTRIEYDKRLAEIRERNRKK